MNVLKRVNIIGRETHGGRYRDAALFYPTVESLAYNDSHFADYDTVILAEPYLWNDQYATGLAADGFDGILILEKLPVSSWKSFVQLRQNNHSYHIYHAMLRLFENQTIDPSLEHFTIKWPNLIDSNMSKVHHTLPNALLFCLAQLDIAIDHIYDIDIAEGNLNITLLDKRHNVTLVIYDTHDATASVQVNDESLQWPSYIQLIHRFFDSIVNSGSDWRTDSTIIGDITKVIESIK